MLDACLVRPGDRPTVTCGLSYYRSSLCGGGAVSQSYVPRCPQRYQQRKKAEAESNMLTRASVGRPFDGARVLCSLCGVLCACECVSPPCMSQLLISWHREMRDTITVDCGLWVVDFDLPQQSLDDDAPLHALHAIPYRIVREL